jgi:tRNA A37 threonylcarbamoyladenosine dehydratase
MHIEKNMFKNIFNTIIDIKGKTIDNIKAKMNIVLFCGRRNIELLNDGVCLEKPKTTFSLD